MTKRTDSIILLLGQTGAGKSNFINKAAGRTVASVGCSLLSHTKDVQPISVAHGNDNYVFVDTPGLNNIATTTDPMAVLRLIAGYLRSLEKSTKLAGIVYFHDINSDRIEPSEDSKAVDGICRYPTARSVVFATTMWDDVKEEVGKQHEEYLSNIHWKSMLDKGSSMRRFRNTDTSAWEIIDTVLERNPINISIILKDLDQVLETPPQPGRPFAGIFSFLFHRPTRKPKARS